MAYGTLRQPMEWRRLSTLGLGHGTIEVHATSESALGLGCCN